MDYAKNKRYFKPIKWKLGIIVSVIGLACIAADSTAFGLLMVAAGIAFIALQIIGRPSDEDIDRATKSQLENMKTRALRKLGVDEDEVNEIAPIVFDGYNYDRSLIKCGKDGKYRSSKYQAVMFFFSSNEVYCYTYDFSIVESSQKEATDVYFYKDIVSVSTQTEGTEYSVGKGKVDPFDYESFKLTTAGGTSISCSVRNYDDAQRSINGMRALIKEKKMA